MFSSQRASTIKPKTSVTKKTVSNTTGSRSSTPNVSNSKAGILDKINNTDIAQGRESCKSIPENVETAFDTNTAPDCNVSELSIIKLLEAETRYNVDEDYDKKKLREELESVKRDLAMKNILVERLMKENSDVRREINDLVATVDTAKDQVNLKLKVYTGRIQDLEEEVKKLRYENKLYQEHLQKVTSEKSAKTLDDLEGHVGKYYYESKQKAELFYKSLNQQITRFLEMSREQYENFNSTFQSCAEGTNRYSSLKGLARAQTPTRGSASRSSFSKGMSSTPTPQSKARGFASPSNTGREGPVPRSLSGSGDKRRRIATLHNLNDLISVNRTENSFGSVTNKNESARKTPKEFFSAQVKGNETFRINTQPVEDNRF